MNEITTVCNKLVYKRYALESLMRAESASLKLLSRYIPKNIPEIALEESNLTVMEYIEGINGFNYNNKEYISREVTRVVLDLYSQYEPLDPKQCNSWKNILESTLKEFSKVFGNYGHVLHNLELLRRNTESIKLTLLHRDLHLGNIIMNGNTPIVIDFEHAMEGPLELEFQNSIFWNDDASLCMCVIREVINEACIDYNLEYETVLQNFYIADQLLKANHMNDLEKVTLLLAKAKIISL